jgi:hypothetical protein
MRELTAVKGRRLGSVTIKRREGNLLFARFVPGRDFPAVESLFEQFEEAANSQALAAVDRIDAAIRALGLKLAAAEGEPAVPLSDVQIWSDGQMSCRIPADVSLDRNGVPPRKP